MVYKNIDGYGFLINKTKFKRITNEREYILELSISNERPLDRYIFEAVSSF